MKGPARMAVQTGDGTSLELNYHRSPSGVISITPVRRNFTFELEQDRVTDWFDHCPQTTHFFSTMSIVTPLVERYIIEGVRHYRHMIDDPNLSRQIDGLFAQEAIHSREHAHYNALLRTAGLPVDQVEKWWQKLLALTCAPYVAPWFRLASIMMLEHHTAAASSKLLDNPLVFADSAKGYKDLMTWHSLEETEHKSVTFDLWTCVIKRGWKHYVLRTSTVLIISVPFWSLFYISLARVIYADKKSKKTLKGYWHLLKFMFGRQGLIASNAWTWIEYFIPGYHPWRDDNSTALKVAMDELLASHKPEI